MKKIIEAIIRKKNPSFSFDEHVTFRMIVHLFWNFAWQFIRGLRIIFYGKMPGKIFLGKGVILFATSRIQFGNWTKIGEYSFLSALGSQGIRFGNSVSIGAFSRLVVSTSFNNIGSFIRIGNNVGIGEYAYLGGAGGLEIGDDCIVGEYFSCHPENHNYEPFTGEPFRLMGVKRKGITIGKNCWIGTKVTVLDGVTIGDNCVLAAGAIITKSMPPNAVVAGVPAKVIKYIKQ